MMRNSLTSRTLWVHRSAHACSIWPQPAHSVWCSTAVATCKSSSLVVVDTEETLKKCYELRKTTLQTNTQKAHLAIWCFFVQFFALWLLVIGHFFQQTAGESPADRLPATCKLGQKFEREENHIFWNEVRGGVKATFCSCVQCSAVQCSQSRCRPMNADYCVKLIHDRRFDQSGFTCACIFTLHA